MNRNAPWRSTRSLQNLAKSDWYRITNKVGGIGPAQIHIYDEIGFLGIGAQNFVRDLALIDGPVDVHINSPGGEVFDGITIYNALQGRRDVTVYVDGLCASIASVIAMAGHPVLMARQSTMMIHEGHAMGVGNSQDLRELAEQCDRQSNNIANIYSERTGKPVGFWRELMKAETWLTADEAIEHGLADRLQDSGAGRAVSSDKWDLSVFNKGPSNAASHPWQSPQDHMHEPVTGRHMHNHAAFGSTDGDDGIHGHAHDHNNDATHQHEHMSHDHQHDHDGDHVHAHPVGMDSYGSHAHDHVHHAGTGHEGGSSEGGTVSNKIDIVLADSFPEAVFYDRNFSSDQRKAAAKKGHAMKDGSYPIETCGDAHNARQAYGRAPEEKRSAVAAHIRSRESALSCPGPAFSPGGTSDSSSFDLSDADLDRIATQFKALRGA